MTIRPIVTSAHAALLRIFCFSLALLLLISVDGFSAPAPRLHDASLLAFEKQAALVPPDEWRFVFLGDNRGGDEKFKEILQRAAGFKPLFILHGGDIVQNGTAEELAHFLEVVGQQKDLPPLFIVRGNHEGNGDLFEKLIGPLDYILDSQRLGFRLVVVDNADNSLKDKEVKFLDTQLDQSRRNQFVSMHVPPKTGRWPRHSFKKGRDELFRLMTERKVNMGLFAHIHLFDKDEINGIPLLISGGAGARLYSSGYSGDADYHIIVVEIKKGKVSYRVEWM